MKEIVYREYGSPDVLSLEDVPAPAPGDDEVLVKIHATSLNSYDQDLLRGWPLTARMWGFRRPRNNILGTDIAGQVEAVGREVTQLQIGDEVFGEISKKYISIGWGGFAEYACIREKNLLLKPANMTFEQASTLPQVGALALAGLRYNGQIQPGQKVLLNGAGGGVGTLAVQIAKHFGAEVTGVDSPEKLELVTSLGADHVIDYTQADFTQYGPQYDLIIDVATHRSMFDYKRALNPGGAYGVIGRSQARFSQTVFLAPWISRFSSKKMGAIGSKPNQGLDLILEVFKDGKVVPIIDSTYPLSETAQAFRYFAEERVQGKIVITM